MSVRLLHYSDIENACDDPVRMGRLAGTIQSIRGEDAVVAGTGDNTAPGVLAHYCEGRHVIRFRAYLTATLLRRDDIPETVGVPLLAGIVGGIVANVFEGRGRAGVSFPSLG